MNSSPMSASTMYIAIECRLSARSVHILEPAESVLRGQCMSTFSSECASTFCPFKIKILQFRHTVKTDWIVVVLPPGRCYSIVKYAPQIEILRIEFNKRIRHRNSIHFGLLRKLNTFTLNGKAMREFILASIHELVAANVRHLNLVTLDLSSFHRIEGVSKLKSVRILHLSYVKNLTFDIILGICMELIVRMELHLICNDCSDFIVKLIETCEKLHRFEFCAIDSRRKIGIEFDTLMKMVHIIQQRRDRISCKMIF